jgi:endonuclease/exonuclease/phosphatase family metal-dependent hydrolase
VAMDVLSLNLWGVGDDVDERLDALAAYLRRRPPDVLALQEVEAHWGSDMAQIIGAAVGYPTVLTVRAGGDDGEGLAVCSALEAVGGEVRPLPEAACDHPRAVQLVDLVTPAGTLVRVANTHLAWRLDATEDRSAQTGAICRELRGWSGAVLLCGDLNDVAGSPALERLSAPPLDLVDCCSREQEPRPTFDHANPYLWQPELAGRRVDHILAGGLAMRTARVVLDGRDGPVVSDHYGVRAELERR